MPILNWFRQFSRRFTPQPGRRLRKRRGQTAPVAACVQMLEQRVMFSAAAIAGLEVQVNTETAGHQSAPAVAMDADGDFVVAWVSTGAGSSPGIFAQRYAADGTALGAEFRVNTNTAGFQRSPSVAMDSDGDFVIAWDTSGQGDEFDVFAQRYAADGTPVGSEFRVNANTTGFQAAPSVAMDADGDFVVTWADGRDIFAQRCSAAGTTVGGEFRVSQYTGSGQLDLRADPQAAMDADGDFVIAWMSYGQVDTVDIYARRYTVDGAALGDEFLVNTFTTGWQGSPALAMNAGGDFLISWDGTGPTVPADGAGIRAQRYAADGNAVGSEFQVNSQAGFAVAPRVALGADGKFVVAWHGSGQTDTDVFAQRFDADGTPVGNQFRANTHTPDSQQYSAVAMDADGGFVIAWTSFGQDADFSDGVFAKRYVDGAMLSGLSLSAATVVENKPVATLVGAFSSLDADVVQSVAYSLVGGEGDAGNALFTIQGNELRTNAAFDFESSPNHSIRVRATDTAGFTFEQVFTISVIDVVEARTVIGGFSGALTYRENAPPILLDSSVTVSDPDSPNFANGTLLVTMGPAGNGGERLTIRNQGNGPGLIGVSGSTVLFGGRPIGTVSGGQGGMMTVALNANCTQAALRALIQNLQFSDVSDSPFTIPRSVSLTVRGGDGMWSLPVSKTITETPVNDPPVIAQPGGPVTFFEGGVAVAVFGAATVRDPDSIDLNGGKLNVALAANGNASDRLAIRSDGFALGQVGVNGKNVTFSGTVIGTFTGGIGTTPLVVTFNAAASQFGAQAVLRNVVFSNVSTAPTTLPRTVKATITDGDGGTSSAVLNTVAVVAVNTPPTLAASVSIVTYARGGVPVPLSPAATVTDPDSVNFAGGTISVRMTGNAEATDVLAIRNPAARYSAIRVIGSNVMLGSMIVGTVSGGTNGEDLVITLNEKATPLVAQVLLRNITFSSRGANPSTLPRTVDITLTDGDGGTSNSLVTTIAVI